VERSIAAFDRHLTTPQLNTCTSLIAFLANRYLILGRCDQALLRFIGAAASSSHVLRALLGDAVCIAGASLVLACYATAALDTFVVIELSGVTRLFEYRCESTTVSMLLVL